MSKSNGRYSKRYPRQIGPRNNPNVNRRKAPSNKSLNKKIKTIQKRQELKWLDFLFVDVPMVSNPTATNMILLNGSTVGDTPLTHTGARYTMTSIQFKGNITYPSVLNNITAVKWRLIIFRDLQANGAAPLATNLLDVTNITHYYIAPYNIDYAKRFRIIYDKRGTINPQIVASTSTTNAVPAIGTTTSTGAMKIKLSFKRALGCICESGLGTGTTGTITDIAKNSIYALLLSDASTASTFYPTLEAGSRIIFKDD